MKAINHTLLLIMSTSLLLSCNPSTKKSGTENQDNFNYKVDQFADIKIMRFQVTDFDSLSLKQKELVYYLSEAAKCGRDILWDQNFKYNLLIRKTLEAIVESYKGDKNTEDFKKFMSNPDLKAAMEKGGVMGKPEVKILNKI